MRAMEPGGLDLGPGRARFSTLRPLGEPPLLRQLAAELGVTVRDEGVVPWRRRRRGHPMAKAVQCADDGGHQPRHHQRHTAQ